MSFEIDFLPIDGGVSLGDAIALRYGTGERQKVIVYDAGTQSTGLALAHHIRQHFQTSKIDHLVASHPDAQHVAGLSVLLRQMQVGVLWMHRPWLHSEEIQAYFEFGNYQHPGLKEIWEAKLRDLYELEQLAFEKGVVIKEPFRGQWIGNFHVLSPDKDWYVDHLLPQFNQPIGSPNHLMRFLRCLRKTAKRAVRWVAEQWDAEYLPEVGHTSAENESSVVLYSNLEDYHYGVMLTGHAGVEALHAGLDYLKQLNIDPVKHLQFWQVPHHGALEHLSTQVLNRLLGEPLDSQPQTIRKVAFISTPKNSNYPHPSISNALLRRGLKVVATQGKTKRHQKNAEVSSAWHATQPLDFIERVQVDS